MGAGAADHFGGVLDQAVELARERLDLGREVALEPARAAVADAVQRIASRGAAAAGRRAPG